MKLMKKKILRLMKKNNLIDKDIEKGSEISNEDKDNKIDKENQTLDISIDKDKECNESKKENIEYEFENNEDLADKEGIDINEDTIDKHQIESKFKLTKKTRNLILVGCTIILLSSIYVGKTVSKYENKIFPGTLVYEQDISNLEKEEVLSKLNKIEKNIEDKKVQININNKIYDIQIKNLVSKYNNDKLYEDIIKNQSEKNIFSKFISIASKKNTNYNLYIEIDEKKFNDLKDEIAQDVNIECIEPKVIINDEKIFYKKGEDGSKLDEEALYNDIKEGINSRNLLKENIIINAKLIKDSPKISIDDLKLINHKVSTYTTTYGSGNSRGSNVENAANKIDDLLLMPGEEFSYENAIGPVIASNGYKYAPVISNGKLVDGIGGGVCQVSSTLYNTQLNAGIIPTERRNHSKAVNYVPRGLDATLASGIIDYKFKNTYEYPLVINTKAVNGKLTIEIWSNEDALKGIEYKPVSYVSGNVANTYLYGYDKDGNKVYEKHIDTSVYR
jgi:vancomycin resistance protein YoaR